MKLTELFLNRFLYKDTSQNLETKDSAFLSADSSDPVPTPIASGSAAQDINTGNVFINGNQLEPGTIPQTVLDVSNWGWGQTCTFSSTDLNTVSWGAGNFKSADGTTYSISAGNTGDMTGKTYIYLDLNVSATAYQKTTTPSTAVGVGKVLVAVANPDTTTATYNLSEATQIVGDNILANSINASKITAGQLIVGTNVGLGTAFPTASAGSLAYLSLVETAQLGTTVIVGGYIKTSLLSADNIQTGTLTVDPTNGKVAGITVNKGGSIVLNSETFSNISTISFNDKNNANVGWDIFFTPTGGGGFNAGELDIIPQPSNTRHMIAIGNSTYPSGLIITGTTYATDFDCHDISPSSNATYDIGTAASGFKNIYLTGGVEFNGGSNFMYHDGTSFQFNSTIKTTGDIYAGATSGSLIAGSSGYIVCRGSYFYPQSITYKDGSGVNQTKTFLVV